MSNTELLETLNKLKTDFYTNESKNVFFKNNQKLKCAEIVSKQINLIEILQKTVFIIPNTNKIYLDYPTFKLFANNTNNEEIINYIIGLLSYCIQTHTNYEMHINLNGFSISAAERYKLSIQLFCNKCCIGFPSDISLASQLINMHIYYTPSVIDSITILFSKFMDPNIPKKMVLHSKMDSPRLIADLLQ